MARIRLRHCYIRLLDGFRALAKVAASGSNGDTVIHLDEYSSDHGALPQGTRFTIDGVDMIYTITAVTAGPATGRVLDGTIAIGDDDLDVDQITGRVPVGTEFTIDGVTGTFTVTGTTETSDDTTNIQFTPVLEEDNLPVTEAVITFVSKPASLTISPPLATGVGLPTAGDDIEISGRCLLIKVGDGNLTWDETFNHDYEYDRGEIDAVVEGDDEPLSISLDMVYEFATAVTGTNVPTPEDVIKRRGEAADWITTGSDPCEVFAVDLEVDYFPPCNEQHEITVFPELRWDNLSHDLNAASISMRARCKVLEPETIRRNY